MGDHHHHHEGKGEGEEEEAVRLELEMERVTSVSVSVSNSCSRVVPFRIHDEDDESFKNNNNNNNNNNNPISLGILFQLHDHDNKDADDQQKNHRRLSLGLPDDGVSGTGIGKPDDWLPITQSRKGNSFTATYLLLCSGLGIQSLLLPLAFISLGWVWGIVCLSVVFGWQLYTTRLLVHLHQPSFPSSSHQIPITTDGPRYSRFVVLSIIAFGPRIGKLLAIFPTMYLSGGTCVLFIITGGSVLELLSKLLCPHKSSLTGAEWFLVFVCTAIFISLFFPTLGSLAPVSLLGSLCAALYLSLLWTLSIAFTKCNKVTPSPNSSEFMATNNNVNLRGILDAIGIIALTFRGHNLVLEIQGTMPSNPHRPARNLMRKGVAASYAAIASCFFPLAIGGYWAYGDSMIGKDHGILDAFAEFHKASSVDSKWTLATIYLTMLLHLLCAFQIYGMPTFDNFERIYVTKKNRACPTSVRLGIRLFFGGLTYLIAVAFPFLPSLGAFIGAITLPLTLAYPCFMWLSIKKPKRWSNAWFLNLGLGCLGIVLSFLLFAAASWHLLDFGLDANFFKPH